MKRPSYARVLANDAMSQLAFAGIILPVVFIVFLAFNPPQAHPALVYMSIVVPILVASLSSAAWRYCTISWIVQNGVEVKAKVLSSEKTTSNQGLPIVHAKLSYEIDHHRYEANRGFALEDFQTGDEVTLMVDPRKPRRSVLRNDYFWKPEEPSKSTEHLQRLNLPVEESSLWPRGKLLQVESIAERLTQKDSTAFFLTNNRLTIGRRPMPSSKNEAVAHPFHEGPFDDERSYEAINISRIELSPSLFREPLSIWVKDDDVKEKRIIKASIMGIPRTIVELVDEGIRQGVIPSNGKQWTIESASSAYLQLMVSEMERQFKKAAPMARIDVKGQQMSQEVFRKLVK